MSNATDVVREYFDCWNRRDWERFRSLMHRQYTYTGGDGQEQPGPEAGMAIAQMFATALPDGRISILNCRADGDFVTTEFIGKGTHRGELMGIAPTGKTVTIPVCNVMEVRDGKVYREREYMDTMHMLAQLGVVQAPAPVRA